MRFQFLGDLAQTKRVLCSAKSPHIVVIWVVRDVQSLRSKGMHPEKALEIIRLLADGVDPATGEVFPDDSPYHQPDVIRALHRAAVALQNTARNERKRARLPANQGKPWTPEVDKLLVREFDAGRPLEELASEFERTVGSIQARLYKLGRDPDRGEGASRAKRPRPPKEVDDSFLGEVFRHRRKWRV